MIEKTILREGWNEDPAMTGTVVTTTSIQKWLVLQNVRTPGPRLVAMTARFGGPLQAPYGGGDEIIGVRTVLERRITTLAAPMQSA